MQSCGLRRGPQQLTGEWLRVVRKFYLPRKERHRVHDGSVTRGTVGGWRTVLSPGEHTRTTAETCQGFDATHVNFIFIFTRVTCWSCGKSDCSSPLNISPSQTQVRKRKSALLIVLNWYVWDTILVSVRHSMFTVTKGLYWT